MSGPTPMGTAFTHQGRLTQGGLPADGVFDFQFALYDDPDQGSLVGGIVELPQQPVSHGLFTVTLDFGNVFTGGALWLEVRVRSAGGEYAPVLPRNELTPNAARRVRADGRIGSGRDHRQRHRWPLVPRGGGKPTLPVLVVRRNPQNFSSIRVKAVRVQAAFVAKQPSFALDSSRRARSRASCRLEVLRGLRMAFPR